MHIYKSLKLVTLVLFIATVAFFAGCNRGITPPITPNTYTITASSGSQGSISPSENITVNQGSDKSFTITPDAGYSINDVLVDGSSVGAVSSYTFTNITEDHTISATLSVAPGLVHNLSKGTYYNTIQDGYVDVYDATNYSRMQEVLNKWNAVIGGPVILLTRRAEYHGHARG